jgi:hypothetical protein
MVSSQFQYTKPMHMKKLILLTVATSCMAITSYAQITKGSTFLGGSIHLFAGKEEPTNNSAESKTTNWGFRPQLGKVIAENKVAGIFLNTSQSLSRQSSPSSSLFAETRISSYGGGAFYRQYYPLGKRFYLFGDGSFGLHFDKDERKGNNGMTNFVYQRSKGREVNVGLTPGISFAATRKLHLEAAFSNLVYLRYRTYTTTDFSAPGIESRAVEGRQFTANADANAFSGMVIGLRWILPSS